jgi:hypothetical protein
MRKLVGVLLALGLLFAAGPAQAVTVEHIKQDTTSFVLAQFCFGDDLIQIDSTLIITTVTNDNGTTKLTRIKEVASTAVGLDSGDVYHASSTFGGPSQGGTGLPEGGFTSLQTQTITKPGGPTLISRTVWVFRFVQGEIKIDQLRQTLECRGRAA